MVVRICGEPSSVFSFMSRMCRSFPFVCPSWSCTMRSCLTSCLPWRTLQPNSGFLRTQRERLDHPHTPLLPFNPPPVSLTSSLLPLSSLFPGFCGHPRFGRATSSLQERGVLHSGTRTCQAADRLHPPQRPVLSLPLSVLCHCAHQGELHRGRGAAQDGETQPGTHSGTGRVLHYPLQVEDMCTCMCK